MLIIKKIGILVILNALVLINANAEARTNIFTISPAIGFIYGHAEEIVYKYPDMNLYYSELLWDLKPLFYAGFEADYGPREPFRQNNFVASISFKYGFPLRTGTMENRDWLAPSHNDLTHYSWHDAYSRGAFLLDVSIGHSWSFSNSLALTACGEFSYKRLSWSGKDGQIQLPPTSYIPEGEVIRYTQNWFILAPGLSLNWKPALLFSIKGNLNYSPLIYCYARDDHWTNNLTFLDHLFLGHYFKGGGEFVFTPAKNLDFLLDISYTLMTGTRGHTYQNGVRIEKDAGAGYSAFDLGLAVKIQPFDRN